MSAKEKIILYVDDDPDDRELLTDVVKKWHPEIEVILSGNGQEALSFLMELKINGKHMPSLIVLDINMPYLDGRQTAEQLLNDTTMQRIPMIIFSSSEKPDDKIIFNEMGIPYYSKPTSLSLMGQIVNQMIAACC